MMNRIKNLLFLVPTFVILAGTIVGLKSNVVQFPKISYPSKTEEIETEVSKEVDNTPKSKINKKYIRKDTSTKILKTSIPVKKLSASVPTGEPADGTYVGEAVCDMFYYTVQLKVKFQKGKAVSISDLKIIGNKDDENQAYWEKAWRPMVERILKKQKSDVDVVSGATYSSEAIKEAYSDAYKKAVSANGGKTAAKKSLKKSIRNKKKPSKKIEVPDNNKVPEGKVKDGTYTVSANCIPDEDKAFKKYVLTADVTFVDGKLTVISEYISTDESNKSYYMKAANGNTSYPGVVFQLISKQSISGINAVSGATCSSKTIVELYLKALTKATGVEQTTIPETTGVTAETTTKNETESDTTGYDSPVFHVNDGTYTVSTIVMPDDEMEFWKYEMTADVTFKDGLLTAVENVVIGDVSNRWYCDRALNGTKNISGVVKQMIEKQSSNIDVVSGATCSSEAFVQIFENALLMAEKKDDK